MPVPGVNGKRGPYWTTTDYLPGGLASGRGRLYLGDVIPMLRGLPPSSVQCIITSPPYWGLRDYRTGTWDGGDIGCDHQADGVRQLEQGNKRKPVDLDRVRDRTKDKGVPQVMSVGNGICLKCGAIRMDLQIGSEPSPDCGMSGKAQCGQCFVCTMVTVFREVRRVLRDDGTLWLNLGDSYRGGNGGGDLKSGNLVGVPWRVALALQADGWILRQEIIWAKPSPMPESVRNRCTKAHEQVFLFAKSNRYYCDMEAIKEDAVFGRVAYPNAVPREGREATSSSMFNRVGDLKDTPGRTRGNEQQERSFDPSAGRNRRDVWTVDDEKVLLEWLATNEPDVFARFLNESRNKGDVWKISSQGYPGAHFATFPPKLVIPMILAGTSEKGCCVRCGVPWKRVVREKKLTRERPNEYVKRTGEEGTGNSCANTVAGVEVITLGWKPGCSCRTGGTDPRPCIVLDPFVGSGTVVAEAIRLGRNGWGIDLSEKYLKQNAIPRIEGVLLSYPILKGLVGREVKRMEIGEKLV